MTAKRKTWPGYMKGKMGPLMKKYLKAGKSHGAAHKSAMGDLAAGWAKYKKAHPLPAKAAVKKRPPKKKRTVKKKRTTRKKARCNPIAKTTTRMVRQAAKLFEKFSGEEPKFVDKVTVPRHTVLMRIGLCDGVLYSARRDGKKEKYIHEFTGKSRPVLASSHDGKQLYLLAGHYDFTADGIVDKK